MKLKILFVILITVGGEIVESAIIVAIISGIFTLCGSFIGVITSSKLTAYRIEQLEKRVDKHNNLIERTYGLEDKLGVQTEKLQNTIEQLSKLEKRVG